MIDSKAPRAARLLFGALLACALGAAPGCNCRDDQSMFIDGVIPVSDPPECTPEAEPDVFLGGGVWDVSVASIYTLSLRVVSGLVALGDPGALAAEPNYINLAGFNVTVEAPAGVGGFGQVSGFVNIAGVIAPMGTLAIFGMPLLGPEVAEDVRGDLAASGGAYEVVVTLSPIGETLGGVEIVGAEFSFPILVCFGCLVYGCDASGVCGTVPADTSAPCRPGQDEAVHCGTVGLTSCP